MLPISGVKIATIETNIKYKNRDDVLLVHFENGAEVAGVFTSASFKAAPVIWCQNSLKNGKASALIVNSGNANAFTGKPGDEALDRVVSLVAKSLNCSKEQVFISSTGVIGEVLPDQKITAKIPELVKNFSNDAESWIKAAKAIMTTDLQPKYGSKIAKIGDIEVKINAFAKGSGMIAPNMATMLGYIFTDADISGDILQKLLSEICNRTFNAITVDSDQSTNDTVLLFATKAANNPKIDDSNSKILADFKEKLEELMLDLAKKIVIDGEGASKLIEVNIEGAKSEAVAKKIAFLVANSPLVKTAIAGADPNWGRLVMAVGKSEENLNSKDLSIKIGDCEIVNCGEISKNYQEKEVHNYLKGDKIKINIKIGNDHHNFKVWTCDLNEEYIKINKDYRS